MLALAARLATIGPDWLWHPLGQCTAASSNRLVAAHEITRCKSYNFVSGLGSDLSEISLIFTGIAALLAIWRVYKRHTECHVATCKKHGHPVHCTPYRACHEHHPASEHEPDEPITADHIKSAHTKVRRRPQ